MSKDKTPAQERFFNRELSWLRFNERVLEEAEDAKTPTLERARFLSIFSSNMDEFFMIRVAGLYRQVDAGIPESGIDKRAPAEQIRLISEEVARLTLRLEKCQIEVMNKLADAGVVIAGAEELNEAGKEFVRRYYEEVVYPVVTPMIVGPKHPFPNLQNGMLYLIVSLREKKSKSKGKRKNRFAFVAVPSVLGRFVPVSGQACEHTFVPMESILVTELASLFSGYEIEGVNAIRVTRDADIALDEEATENLRRAMAKKLLGRRHGHAVRLEHGGQLDATMNELLMRELDLAEEHLYPCNHLMQPGDLGQLVDAVDAPELGFTPIKPLLPEGRRESDVFSWIRQSSRLVYHPYHAFDPVAELVAEAAMDPGVLAIKMTLYRTSGKSPVIAALTRAAEAGKHVTVVVELRARFDEQRNIEWAQRLESAGAHVVYGLVGMKTHSKALLIVRREVEGIRRYMHLGTGNYNDATARLYTDFGLFSCDDALGQDISALFNVITGATTPPEWNLVAMSPLGLRQRVIRLIERQGRRAAAGKGGRIIAKMNSLVDRGVIDALYAASQQGASIDLIVRGICCLRPGVEGLSENIRVRSIVGRFLEHARVFVFGEGSDARVFLSSADWMSRNLDRRVELMFPVRSEAHQEYIQAMLELQLADNVKARELAPDGKYSRVKRVGAKCDSQLQIYDMSQQRIKPPSSASKRLVPIASQPVSERSARS